MDEENIFLGEASYRFIRYRLIKKYSTHDKERTAAELLNSEHSHSHGQKFMALENTKTDFFTDSNIRCRVWFAGAPRASTTPDKHQNLQR
jgi:hypothetical protein